MLSRKTCSTRLAYGPRTPRATPRRPPRRRSSFPFRLALQRSPMSGIARTNATGPGGMLEELLAWSSSFEHDRALVREDLIGSAAHVTMLARTRIIPPGDARTLRDALHTLYGEVRAGKLALAEGEEDVHMAVEAELGKRVGDVAA